jgi:hypothetical protein
VRVKQLGAEILDGPAEFPYGGPDGWYAAYFLGPDRLKFEVVHMPAAEKAYTEALRALERGRRDSQQRCRITLSTAELGVRETSSAVGGRTGA